MKFYIFFCIVISSPYVIAQNNEGGNNHSQCELNFQIFNNFNNYTVNFMVTPVWNEFNLLSSYTYIAEANNCNFAPLWQGHYDIATKTISLQGVSNLCVDNGLHYGTEPPAQMGCPGYPNYSASYFQSGLYYIVIRINGIEKTNFYYDNRHSRFPTNPCNLQGTYNNDIGVRYDVEENKLYYRQLPNSNPSMSGWNPFYKGEALNWWEITEVEEGYNYVGFNTRYFAILNEPECVNNAPFLTWQPPNVQTPISHYELQRGGGTYSFQTIYSSTNNLSYHDSNLNGYCDPNLPSGNIIQYRVVVVYQNQDLPLEYSNIQKVKITRGHSKRSSLSVDKIPFLLEQNFPNPFNPGTKFSYQISESGFVTLKIFNNLGQEVQELVAEFQNSGKYEIDFNGELLPSGVYFYRLSYNGISIYRKMILVK